METSSDYKRIIQIGSGSDVYYATNVAKEIALKIGFRHSECISICVAVSELSSNIQKYANSGLIIFRSIKEQSKKGIQIIAEDHGPGITNIELSLIDGYSTSGTLGLGLAGVNRLMDEFRFDNERTKSDKASD